MEVKTVYVLWKLSYHIENNDYLEEGGKFYLYAREAGTWHIYQGPDLSKMFG